MEKIYTGIIDCLEKNRISVLATIIKQEGSAPRGVGTKCLIQEDGRIIGTVGGGQLEATVAEEAMKIFDTQSPTRLHFNLAGTDVDDVDMICRG